MVGSSNNPLDDSRAEAEEQKITQKTTQTAVGQFLINKLEFPACFATISQTKTL